MNCVSGRCDRSTVSLAHCHLALFRNRPLEVENASLGTAPPVPRYSTVTLSTAMRWKARLRASCWR